MQALESECMTNLCLEANFSTLNLRTASTCALQVTCEPLSLSTSSSCPWRRIPLP